MVLSNMASSSKNRDIVESLDHSMDSDDEPFLYTGQSEEDIPRNVMHVKVVDPAIKKIGGWAFYECEQLVSVDLCEGLERINCGAFQGCTSLQNIIIPPTVKEIEWQAFKGCSLLRNVELNEGLERIGDDAFRACTSLTSITIPSTVRNIGWGAFKGCCQLESVELHEGLKRRRIGQDAFEDCTSLVSIRIPSNVGIIFTNTFKKCTQLVTVELCEGLLKSIEGCAFESCTSLERIVIPSTVKKIGRDAFKDCDRLESIQFCDEIEQFVKEASLPWWNHGVSEVSLLTYSFLAHRKIPARFGAIRAQSLKDIIHEMLQWIPKAEEFEEYYYFDSIEYWLSNYVYFQEVAPFLELALWKAKITEQSNGNHINNDTKILCRVDSLKMFPVIFPNVLLFLTVDADDESVDAE
jgi:hypothetical protein